MFSSATFDGKSCLDDISVTRLTKPKLHHGQMLQNDGPKPQLPAFQELQALRGRLL